MRLNSTCILKQFLCKTYGIYAHVFTVTLMILVGLGSSFLHTQFLMSVIRHSYIIISTTNKMIKIPLNNIWFFYIYIILLHWYLLYSKKSRISFLVCVLEELNREPDERNVYVSLHPLFVLHANKRMSLCCCLVNRKTKKYTLCKNGA